MTFAESYYTATKNEAERWLFRIPGVVGVAIGPKIIGGRLTRIPSIQVYVSRKRVRSEIQRTELIPTSIEGVATDVLEGAFPEDMSATVRCRNGRIMAATVVEGRVEITSPGHGLSDGDHVRIFGMPLQPSSVLPITFKGNDVFALPPDAELDASVPPADFAFWTEVCSFDDGLCCCPTGPITDAASTNPVKITSPSHGLQSGDRIKIARITSMTEISGKEFTVGKVTKDTFGLHGIDGTHFTMAGAGLESGDWEKLCVARTGAIQRVRMGAPVVFISQGHSLKRGDRVHIIFASPDSQMLQISSWNKDDPFTVAAVDVDTFTVEELSDVGSTEEMSTVGCWTRILPDARRYSRVRGGIRVAMSKNEVVERSQLINTGRAGLGTIIENERVRVQEGIAYGTLGCLAVDNATNATVILSNYHVLYSVDENHVHHPDYSPCKSHRIAERMRHADGGTQTTPGAVDAAIAKLTHPSKADPVIVDIGDVRGTTPVTIADILAGEVDDNDVPESHQVRGYRVRKRGITTLVTEGVVIGLNGTFRPPDAGVPLFLSNQIIIQAIAGDGRGAFCFKGDSGAAVVNDDNKVVGLLCGGDPRGRAFASPIASVEDLLNIKVLAAETSAPTSGGTPADDLVIIPSVPDLLAAVTSEVAATPGGARLLEVVMSNHREVEDLVHHNRRMTVAWHRNAGPSILRELHEFVVRRDVTLPEQIDGMPLHRCLENIFCTLRQCGSAKLAADLERHGNELLLLSNLTYSGLLDALAGGGAALHA